jgi:acyl-CoA synthetase (AMP-forming)/AMP-acid ligase II
MADRRWGWAISGTLTGRLASSRPTLICHPEQANRIEWVYSGDLVRRDGNGLLYYVGRRDRMIKTLGFRVSPDEIGDVIQASGQVSDAAVVSEPDTVRGERIVACVVLRGGCTLDALTRFCKLELPRHMQPARYEVLAAIPRNANGKHDIPFLKQELLAKQPSAG